MSLPEARKAITGMKTSIINPSEAENSTHIRQVFPREKAVLAAHEIVPGELRSRSKSSAATRNPQCPDPDVHRHSRLRRFFFRSVRLLIAGALVFGFGAFAKKTFTGITSDRAYVNAELIALRAPIDGQLHLAPLTPGVKICSGTEIFRVENLRVGNKEAMWQLNWGKELAERLRAESDEAETRYQQQQPIFGLHKSLYEEKLISRLEFLAEENKLTMARTAMTNKQAQAHLAEERCREVERQVELQKEAVVRMPFDGVAWTIGAKNGTEISTREPVLQVIDPKRIWVDAFLREKHASRFTVGTAVIVRTSDDQEKWSGRVESIRGGVGEIPGENFALAAPGGLAHRQVALRIKMDSANPFAASQFFGVGRSVVVTLENNE